MKGAYRDDQAWLTVRVPEARRELEDLRRALETARRQYEEAKAALEKAASRLNPGMFALGLVGGASLILYLGSDALLGR
jgi:hypothetical protein